MINTQTPVIIIPAYEPTPALISVLQTLQRDNEAPAIIIVNDGSSPKSDPIFEAVRQFENVILLQHAVNLGKGQALKTGFNYFLLHFPESIGVITADAE